MRTLASYREALSVAVRSMLGSKLRSFLTLLGVILATTTLIVVMSVVHGMDVYVANQVSDMGVDGFQVQRILLLGDFDPKRQDQPKIVVVAPRWSRARGWRPAKTGTLASIQKPHTC